MNVKQHTTHGRPGTEGARLDHVGLNEAITGAAFGGRRRRVYARIAALSGARPADRVLDIGCGGGYLTRLLAAAVGPAGQVTGVDPAAGAVRHAQRRAPANCSYLVGVAQDLDLPDRSFDVVTSTLATHHIPEAELAAAFSEMFRVLRPGGTLLAADFRPPARRHTPHALATRNRHGSAIPLEDLAAATRFRLDAHGELPLLRYIRATRPPAT
ncbi:MAG: class I SAM-dependent methyltransferase [Nocardiopsaceae bacterium]|jgi:ubiquinone/menaquinone biosynthesis C-methylase UbiE|nr:class I SAM-dependent methyltransferase [Nocardiopsaceae bacterium]